MRAQLSARKRLFKPCSCFSSVYLPTPPLQPSPPTHPRARYSDVSPYRPINGNVPMEPPPKSRRTRLPGLKENRAPESGRYGSPGPILLRGNSRQRSRRPSKSPIILHSNLTDRKELTKADLRRGSFSYKQAIIPTESSYSIPVVKISMRSLITEPNSHTSRDYRSPSPGITARSRRFQQLSRHYRLDRLSLQREVSSRSSVSLQRQETHFNRYATPERLPSTIFMAELDDITHISDYSER